jgi:large subunit ribosomal protein L25
MDVITLDAQPRELGRAAAKAVRREGEVPCVLYGPHQEPVHFRVPVLALRSLIYTSETHRVALSLDGESYDCIVKSITYHPVTDVPTHVDFYALTAGEAVTMTVPVLLVGTPEGVKAGGILAQPLNDLEVRCLPADIPGHIEVDVAALEIGDSIHVSDITVENVEVITELTRTIATVSAPIAEPVEEEPELDLLEEGELPEGAAEEGGETGGEAEDEGEEAQG